MEHNKLIKKKDKKTHACEDNVEFKNQRHNPTLLAAPLLAFNSLEMCHYLLPAAISKLLFDFVLTYILRIIFYVNISKIIA